jgi:hypothetical protein
VGAGAPGGHGGDAVNTVTVEHLEDWVLNGANWRAVELDDRHAVIDMCSCTGELMDRVQSDQDEVIEYVRARGGESQ